MKQVSYSLAVFFAFISTALGGQTAGKNNELNKVPPPTHYVESKVIVRCKYISNYEGRSRGLSLTKAVSANGQKIYYLSDSYLPYSLILTNPPIEGQDMVLVNSVGADGEFAYLYADGRTSMLQSTVKGFDIGFIKNPDIECSLPK